MIYIIFWLFSIIFLALVLEPKPERAIPLGTISVVVFTYFLGLVDALKRQPYVMIGLVIVGTIFLIVKGVRKQLLRIEYQDWIRVLSILIFITVFLVIFFRKYLVIANGAYNYYASIVKYLWHTDSLVGAESACQNFSYYYPGVGLWHYFINKCLGEYKDWHLFFSYALLIYICTLPLIGKNDIKDKKSVVSMIINLLNFLIFPWAVAGTTLYFNLAVDMATAVSFCYVLWYVLTSDKANSDRSYDYGMTVSIVFLGISKSPALLFAVVCLLIYVVKIFRIQNKVNWIKNLRMVIVSGIGIAGILSWKFFCKYIACYPNGMFENNSVEGTVFPNYTASTIKRYIKMLFTEPLNAERGITTIVVLLLAVVIFVNDVYKKKKLSNGDKITVGIIGMGYVCFCLGHLYMYLFEFSEAETQVMSSYARYMIMYVVPVLFILMMYVRKQHLLWLEVIIGVMLLVSVPYDVVVNAPGNTLYNLRTEYIDVYGEAEVIATELEDYVEEGETFCILYSEDVQWMLPNAVKYQMIPQNMVIVKNISEDVFMNSVHAYEKCFYLTVDENPSDAVVYSIFFDGNEVNYVLVGE